MIMYLTYCYEAYYEYAKYIEDTISAFLAHSAINQSWEKPTRFVLSKSKSTFMLRYINLLKR